MINDQLDRLIYDVIEETIPSLNEFKSVMSTDRNSEYIIKTRSTGIVCGLDIVKRIVEIIDDSIIMKIINGNGSIVEEGDIIAILRGVASSITTMKSLLITIVETLSAIATKVYNIYSVLHDSSIRLYAPDDFTPLYRSFEKHAFLQAGGYDLNLEMPPSNILSAETLDKNETFLTATKTINNMIDHNRIIGIKVFDYNEYLAAKHTECDMIILCDFSIKELAQCFQDDIPEINRIVYGEYQKNELETIRNLQPDGIQLRSLRRNLPSFCITIEQTR